MNFIQIPIALIILAILWLLYRIFFPKKFNPKDVTHEVSETEIDSIQDGQMVKLSGTIALLGETFEAPFSYRNCCVYIVKVLERERPKDFLRTEIIKEMQIGTILVKVGDTWVLIDKTHLNMDINSDWKYFTKSFLKTPKSIVEFLQKHRRALDDSLGFSNDYSLYETILGEDEVISIEGRAKWVMSSQFKLNLNGEKLLMLYGDKKRKVYLHDFKYRFNEIDF